MDEFKKTIFEGKYLDLDPIKILFKNNYIYIRNGNIINVGNLDNAFKFTIKYIFLYNSKEISDSEIKNLENNYNIENYIKSKGCNTYMNSVQIMKQNAFSKKEIGKLNILKNVEADKVKNMNDINFSSRFSRNIENQNEKFRTFQNSPRKNEINQIPKIKNNIANKKPQIKINDNDNIRNYRINPDNLQMNERDKYSNNTFDSSKKYERNNLDKKGSKVENDLKKEEPKIEKNLEKKSNEDKFTILEKKIEEKYKDLSKIFEEKFNKINNYFEEKYKIINTNINEVIKYNKQLNEKFDNLKNENIKQLKENQNQINQLNEQIIKSKDKLMEYENIILQNEKKEENYQKNNNELKKEIEKLKEENKKLKEKNNKKEIERNNNIIKTNLVLNIPKFKSKNNIPKKEIKLIGLKSIKEAPFINSVLQCLFQIESLTNYFKNDYSINDKNPEFSSTFKELVLQMYNKNDGCLDSRKLLNTANKIINLQIEDRDDLDNIYNFLKFVLDRLHEELKIDINHNNNLAIKNKLNKLEMKSFKDEIKNESIITDLFGGINEEVIRCLSEKIKSINNSIYKFHSFLYLSFKLNNIIPEKNEITIFECLKNMRKEQTFSNEQFCEICDKKCLKSNQSKIFLCPKILIIMLNYGYGNNNLKVNFEESLDLTVFTKFENENNVEQKNYILSGIITKVRNNFENNYIAYCQNDIDDNWYRYDDEDIKLIYNVRNEIINNEMPLILFYKMN